MLVYLSARRVMPGVSWHYIYMVDRKHWESRIKQLPKRRHALPCSLSFSPVEVSLLRKGLLPQSQDERWVVLLHEGSLDIYRSWTGHCIYSIPVREVGAGLAAEVILVNDDGDQHRRGDDEGDYRMVNLLIERVLNQGAS